MPEGTPDRTTRVRSHYNAGHRVRAHRRRLNWTSVGKSWGLVGFSALTTLALLAEFGLEMVSMIAVILTALFGLLATWITLKATEKQRKMTAKMTATKGKGRGRTTARKRSAARRASSSRTGSAKRRR